MGRTREEIIKIRNQDDANIAEWIDQNVDGNSIGDLGCGWGVMISELKERGWEVWGLDLNSKRIKIVPKNIKDNVWIGDLITTKNLKKSDVALTIEVAEHLSIDTEDLFIKQLMKLDADTIVMTVATTGQEAKSHFNIKPRRMWIDKIEKKGYNENEALEYKFKKDLEGRLKIKAWISWNIMIFNKK